MAEILTEEEIKKLLEFVPKQWYLYDNSGKKIYIKGKTIDEVKELLIKNEYVNYKGDDGITYFLKIGVLCKEFTDYFWFVGYPYSSKHLEIDYDYGFSIFVHKDTSEILSSSAPIDTTDIKKHEIDYGKILIGQYEVNIITN